MPFNGSGVFQRVRNWVADAAAGIKIRADYHDTEDDGFAIGLSNCITKDGQTVVTQNIPMNSKRLTGLADPVNPQDVATKASSDAAIAASAATINAAKVSKTGDAMTGNLTTTGDVYVGFGLSSGSLAFGNGTRYLNWNAGAYSLVGGALSIAGQAASVFSLQLSGKMHATGDITSSATVRGNTLAAGHATNAGIVYLGTDNAHSVGFDGTRYNMPNAPLSVGTPVLGNDAATANWANNTYIIKGGAGTGTNPIYIGWDNSVSRLRLQVDSSPQGFFVISASTALTMESLLARIEALEARMP